MKELAPNVFIETGFPGVTLGILAYKHGLVLIDAPFRLDDVRLWKAGMLGLTRGNERLLINLDEHFDRTLGSRQIECLVAGQDKMVQLFKDRPVTFKPQVIETGAEWEMHNSLVSTRWATPEITFSDRLELHWGGNPLLLESRPGPSSCAIWATLPVEKIVFVGDAVISDAPPFLANASLPAWEESLRVLLTPAYKNYTLVSGRNGVVGVPEVKAQLKTLERLGKVVEKLSEKPVHAEDIQKAAHSFLKHYEVPQGRETQYLMRLQWGLTKFMRKQPSVPLDQPELPI